MEVFALLLGFVIIQKCVFGEQVNLTTLSKLKHGVELTTVENALRKVQSSYKLEDFFWTGSGDDFNEPEDENEYSTFLTTIYVTSTTASSASSTTSGSTECKSCDATTTSTHTVSENDFDADKEFWLLTVLKSGGKDPDVLELRKSLANLYQKAFLRQQAKHLGIHPRIKREDKPIDVYIHKIDKKPINGESKIEVVYHVSVAGQPVAAVTAADDMQLVTDREVKEELGYPFLVKAEPYIRPTIAQELAETKPTWLFVSISLFVLILLIILVMLVAFCVTKNKSSVNDHNVTHAFSEQDGRINEGFDLNTNGKREQNASPTYMNFRNHESNQALNSLRPNSAFGSSSCSSGSINISPLMPIHNGRKLQRPKAAINKTVPLNVASNNRASPCSSTSSSTLSDTIDLRMRDPISPKSYLSMPSVKAFPKGNNPEPLNKVLEPLSVRHLDMHDPDDYPITRHGSFGPDDDPGVLGPVVWNLHKHRMQQSGSFNDDIDAQAKNVSKMRKRFHDLLDDTFSLFGSRRESPQHKPIQVKSHSSIDRNIDEDPQQYPRPKTSESKLTLVPKGAWMSTAPSPLVRPISAPLNRPNTAPRINRDLILADGVLQPKDPAIPLIEEIKKEIHKCSSSCAEGSDK